MGRLLLFRPLKLEKLPTHYLPWVSYELEWSPFSVDPM